MSTGVPTDIARRIPVTAAFETITNRRVSVGLGSRRFYVGVQSSRYHRSAEGPRSANGGYESTALWQAMGYVGCASLALGLVFVSGSVLRASPPVAGYAVVMPIDAKAMTTAPRHKAKLRPLVRAKPAAPSVAATVAVEDWSIAPTADMTDPGLAIERPDPDVAALPTTNGERAVAVYGAPRLVGGKTCRDVSVFVRGADGKVSVSPTTECKAAR